MINEHDDIAGHFSIVRLQESDIPFAHALSTRTGWNQTSADWHRLIRHQPEGCWAARWDGQPVGTVSTTVHGGVLGWIGMMLVHPDFQRRGIATRLMHQAIDFLQSIRVRWTALDATPTGQAVYEKLGFVAESELFRWKLNQSSEVNAEPPRSSPPLTSVHCELDQEAFGVDRSTWLSRLAADSIVVTRPAGFAFLRKGILANYLGPVVAAESDTAQKLVTQCLILAAGDLFWDIPTSNVSAEQLATSLGFTKVRHLIRMRLATEPLPGNLSYQFAIGAPETG